MLREEGRNRITETTTDESGRYEFNDLPVAKQTRYLPVITDPAYVDGAVAPDGAQREPAPLNPAAPGNVVLVARPAETLFLGLVQAGDDRPAAGRRGDRHPHQRRRDLHRPGRRKTAATRSGCRPRRARPTWSGRPATTPSCPPPAGVLKPGTNFGVQANLTTHVPASITGRVVGPDGTPLTGIRVVLYAEGSHAADRLAYTNNDGIYRFNNLVPGRRYAAGGGGSVPASAAARRPGEVVITPLVGLPSGETVWADIRLDVLPAAP